MKGLAKLAVAKGELQAIKVPVEILIGDRDPIRELYVTPLQAVRTDWPMIEIKDAGHLDCIFKRQFIEEIVKWVELNSSR